MIIAGVGDVTHDPSVYLLKHIEGKTQILAGIESERLTRIKHGLKPDPKKYTLLEQGLDFQRCLPSLDRREENLRRCLNYCIEAVHPSQTTTKIKKTTGLDPRGHIDHVFLSSLFQKPAFSNDPNVTLLKASHHMIHAASTFYTSPFKSSAILAIDGYGTLAADNTSDSVLFAKGEGNLIIPLQTIRGKAEPTPEEINFPYHIPGHIIFSNSLGVFYQNITLLLDLGYFNEGKTMGLSAYGKPNLKYEPIQDWIKFNPDRTLSINNREIFNLLLGWVADALKMSPEKKFEAFADLAFIHQVLLEKMIFHLCHGLYQRTGETRLCLTGGVALNSVANGKIMAKTPFKEIHLIPPTGDNGIALGAAFYGAHHLLNLPRLPLKKFNPYLGKTYTASVMTDPSLPSGERDGSNHNSLLSPLENPNNLSAPALAARLISEGKVIAWFSEGAEIGPRALGNRSILADPRSKTMRDYLNLKVKHREFFRPFAPACLPEDFEKYFFPPTSADMKTEKKNAALGGMPFMLEIREAKPIALEEIPAVIHVDRTARVQIVDANTNPTFHQLIQEFKKISGIGILLNTSFNGPSEPIIETPLEAIQCFLNLKMDVLFLNGQGWVKT
jgi:carbamoyltransferase